MFVQTAQHFAEVLSQNLRCLDHFCVFDKFQLIIKQFYVTFCSFLFLFLGRNDKNWAKIAVRAYNCIIVYPGKQILANIYNVNYLFTTETK